MTLSWSPAQADFDVFDLTETVSLLRPGIEGGSPVTYTGVKALGLGTSDVTTDAGGVELTHSTTTWHLKASTVSVMPTRGDVIVATSTRLAGSWFVEDVQKETYGTRYVCQTHKVV